MIPAVQQRTLISSGVEDQASFGISQGDQAHIMRILRDQLYSDRVLAVLREYSSNAWDANRMAGRGDEPIEVSLPTLLQPYLAIKDHGPGLSRNDVFKIYTQYGASTKRDTNIAVGMLGIGSKSAFSYTSSFTITSWHGGTKSVYTASLDERDVGVIQLLHEEPCSEWTGVEIKVPVKNEDFHDFTHKAENLFTYFVPLPKFNISMRINPPSVTTFKNGFIENSNGYSSDAVGVLGCIPYRISYQEIDNLRRQVPLLRNCRGIGLFFEIGEVEFSASREELKYSDRTRAAMLKRLQALADEVKADATTVWNQPGLTPWEKRIKLESYSSCGISDDHLFKHLNISRNIELKSENFKAKMYNIRASEKFQLVIRDDWRSLQGFDVPSEVSGYKRNEWPMLIVPEKGKTPKEVEAELKAFFKEKEADGCPIRMLSSFTWTKPPAKSPQEANSKHAEKHFVFAHDVRYRDKESSNWEIESFVPSDDDVFVIIERFVPIDLPGYVRVFAQDAQLAKLAGIDFPKVRGYKTTMGKPLTNESCKGQPYKTWQKKFYAEVIKSAAVSEVVEYDAWTQRFSGYRISEALAEAISSYEGAGLAADHPIVTFLKRAAEEVKKQRPNAQALELIRNFNRGDFKSQASQLEESLVERYPLFKSEANWTTSGLFAHWAEYILLKDEKLAKSQPDGVSSPKTELP